MCENMILMPNIFLEGEKSSNKYKNPSDPVGAPWCLYGISGYVRPTPKSQKKTKNARSHKQNKALFCSIIYFKKSISLSFHSTFLLFKFLI